jgi:hypothetical protein
MNLLLPKMVTQCFIVAIGGNGVSAVSAGYGRSSSLIKNAVTGEK